MYNRGLSEQTQLDEAATERDQRLRDAAYQNNFSLYANDRQARTTNAFENRRSARDRNYQVQDREDGQQFTTSERVAGENFEAGQAGIQRNFQAGQAGIQRQFEAKQAELERQDRERARVLSQQWNSREAEKDRNFRGAIAAAEAQAKRSDFLSTDAGQKLFKEASESIEKSTTAIQKLDAFSEQMSKTDTGGLILSTVGGVVKWSNSGLQILSSLSADLTKAASQDLKGAISNADIKFLQETVPNIGKTRNANTAIIARMRSIYERVNQYQTAKLSAIAEGRGLDFLREWQAYSKEVPLSGSGPSFDEWSSSVPSYGVNGSRIK